MQANPYDNRDEQEHAAVAALLAPLPDDHPAREAYARGVSTVQLTHLVGDRADLVHGLKEAFLAGYWRTLQGSGGFRP
jgi:hypothetical protein